MVFFKIHHYGLHAVLEFQKFVRFGILQSEDTHYAVADLQHRTYLGELRRKVCLLQFGKQYIRNFRWFYLFCVHDFIRFYFVYVLIVYAASSVAVKGWHRGAGRPYGKRIHR